MPLCYPLGGFDPDQLKAVFHHGTFLLERESLLFHFYVVEAAAWQLN